MLDPELHFPLTSCVTLAWMLRRWFVASKMSEHFWPVSGITLPFKGQHFPCLSSDIALDKRLLTILDEIAGEVGICCLEHDKRVTF